jgi:hypothetical protein
VVAIEADPDFTAALRTMQRRRDAVFLCDTDRIGGFEVYHLTLQRLLWLDYLDNAFVNGRLAALPLADLPAHVIQFLAFMTAPIPSGPIGRMVDASRFAEIHFGDNSTHDLMDLSQGIIDFVRDSLADMPHGAPSRFTEPTASFVAWHVVYFARHFHWSESAIITCPIARLYQYRQANQLIVDPNAVASQPEVAPVHRARRDRLRAALQADKKPPEHARN